jgi:hypothetical protein
VYRVSFVVCQDGVLNFRRAKVARRESIQFLLHKLSLRFSCPGDGNVRFDWSSELAPSSVVAEEVRLNGNFGAFHIVKPVWLLIPVKNRWVAPK